MAALPIISGADAVKAFQRHGWHLSRQKGSHAILTKPGPWVTLSVPQHRELAPGTLRALIRLAGITVEEFRSVL
jgi:predicted RNA binding protein YcfA (HicA-like mRNA interferase family)